MTIEDLDKQLDEFNSFFGEANFLRINELVYKPLNKMKFEEKYICKHIANDVVLVLATELCDLNTALTKSKIEGMGDCYAVSTDAKDCIMLDNNCFITHVYFNYNLTPVLSIRLDDKEYFYECLRCPDVEPYDITSAILDNGGAI